ncbi:MAG: M4 family metallopeptidase, partial [Bacteroidetes bacterium]|nr:M4 family metallopeptidase [Bacteroidota bacterium]
MQNLLHTRLLLLFLSTTLVIAGCIAFGAKKIAANKTQQPDLLALPTNPQNCIKILKTSKVNKIDPYYYSYLLDTTDAKCTARTLRDIINDTIFIQKGVNDSLVGSPQLHKGKNSFSHYYKGIKVDGSGIGMYVENNKIVSVITNFYPHLNIDTTGMLSKEEAVKIAFSHAEIYEGFNTLEWQQYVASHTETLINPQKHIVYYGFYIPRISKKNGGYFVDATNKRFMKYVPGWGGSLLTDCHKCVGASTTQFSCEDTCATNTCTVFTDGVLVAVPTLYDGCQSILADECTIDNKTVYRMAPDTINLTVNDSINVYDGSKYYGGPKAQKIAWCFADSSISKKNTIATTAWYGIKTARSYFAAHAIDYQAPIKVLVHFPESPFDPIGNDALWDQKDKLFIFGSGDDTIMTAPVSVDIVAHEYAHAVLHNKFNIGSHVTNDTSAHRYEAGALHEGIADIFSVLVRKHAYGTINWVIGDEVLIPTSTTLLPRDLAHPENTTPPQALYYNDPAANWDTTQTEIYNHAGIIAKWFYLLANGGTGYHYATDSITVEPLTIDTAEMVLIGGLKKIDSLVLDIDKLTIPSYAEFAVAMAAAAQTISCTTHKQTIRALKAVGLGLNLPGGKTTLLTEDESLCFIDLRMRDCYNDQGFEPNTECDDWLGWNDIWNSPDLWVCPQNDSCYLAASAPPEPAQSNRIGFTIYNAHPNLISDPAQLHLYYTMASSGELWDF